MSLRSIRKNWEGLAEKDPYWAICTHPGKKGRKWNEKDFFLTGETEVNRLFEYLNARQISLPDHDLVLDFGCGVGRLMRALYPHFRSLQGLDVSSSMIEKAEALNSQYLDKISFHLLQTFPGSFVKPGSVSLVICLLVFQHLPGNHSLQYMADLLSLLKPDGLFIFQLITKDVRSMKWVRKIRSLVRVRERLALIGYGDHFQMKMEVLDREKVCQWIGKNGGEILDIGITNHTDPSYAGNLKFIEEKESIDYVSNLFIVRKNPGHSLQSED